jgi:hypothetical protein
MKVLSEIEVAIRLATTQALDVAGRKQAAAVLETNPGRISRLENIENTPNAASERLYLRASEVVLVDRLAGAPYVLEALCALEGRELAPIAEQGVADEGMPAHSAALLKEFAEALEDMSRAIRKGMTPALAKQLYDNLQDVIDRAKDTQAECYRTICQNKPSQVLKAVRQ